MPKNKKPKRTHAAHPYGSSKKNGVAELSQDEIWDDSALIRSWDEAVAEYQYYHSLAARGEDVDEVLRLAEAAEARSNGVEAEDGEGEVSEDGEVQEGVNEEVKEGEVDSSSVNMETGMNVPPESPPSITPKFHGPVRPGTSPTATSASQPVPPVQVQAPAPDQTLENIKMAYYWAGYYSGLYDGQKQVQQPPNHQS